MNKKYTITGYGIVNLLATGMAMGVALVVFLFHISGVA